MSFDTVMSELAALATDRVKKRYLKDGAHEPLFGVPTGAMKPLAKTHMHNQELAEQLYATKNFDAMYFAGVIADPKRMTPDDFDRWVEQAYCPLIGDFIVSVTLSETDFAQDVADRFIQSERVITALTGWSCYEWLLGSRNDAEFAPDKIKRMVETIESTIHTQSDLFKKMMNRFLIAVGVSYRPLHDYALQIAQSIGDVMITRDGKSVALASASKAIQKAQTDQRIGFKRKAVRC